MKKIYLSLILCLAMLVMFIAPAKAEEFSGKSGWAVEYDGKSLSANFTSGVMSEQVSELQPGDSIKFTISLISSAEADTDWWMSNKVLSSFEDKSAAQGGAYEYELIYNGPSGSQTLYSSQTVGGEDTTAGEGLHEATNALEDFFFLDTLSQGQSATITLSIALDGETQGNTYQSTLADLQMSFAVEEHQTAQETPSKPSTVNTGDTNNTLIYLLALAGSGCVCLALGFVALRNNRRKAALEAAEVSNEKADVPAESNNSQS